MKTSKSVLAHWIATATNANTQKDVTASKHLEGVEPTEGTLDEIDWNDSVTKKVAKVITGKARRGNDTKFMAKLTECISASAKETGKVAQEQQSQAKVSVGNRSGSNEH